MIVIMHGAAGKKQLFGGITVMPVGRLFVMRCFPASPLALLVE